MSGFSLNFIKTTEKKVLTDSKLRDDSTKESDLGKDFIKDVKDNEIIGTIQKEVKGPLVIPLITKNNWRTEQKKDETSDLGKNESENGSKKFQEDVEEDEETRLLNEAAKEIMEETAKKLQSWESRGDGERRFQDGQLPSVISNSVPTGFEAEEGALDVSLRAEPSTLEDYENIPIEQYGMAMLRGMGWKPGEGIGGYKKEVVQIIDPLSRPKGLGLGATRPGTEVKPAKEGEEVLVLKRGAFLLIQGGPKRGLYGEVEGLDEENGRVILKMGVGGEVVSVSENVIKLVNKQEYRDRGKVVNLDKYEKYKEKETVKKEAEEDERRKAKDHKRRYKESEKNSRKTRSRSRDQSPEVKRVKKRKTWVRPQLKVRCIDSKFRGGKYFNVKMVVVDVVSPEYCDCRTEEGKLVEEVRTDKMETIVPKGDQAMVMVVRGERKGEVGTIMARNKVKYLATVQLVIDEEVLVLDYDSICQYVGDREFE